MATLALSEWPWRIVRDLAYERNLRTWVVGGAVRDALLGRAVHDWDFAVDRHALRLARAVADALGGAYYTLDAERGTGRVLLTAEDGAQLNLDFAELRGGGLHEDLLLRDFTINAMAIDEMDQLVDPLGGEWDLACHLIRATGEWAFCDDPLRTVRAVRQAHQFSFTIDSQTQSWIRRDAHRLAAPSKERVRDEFIRLIELPGAVLALEQLADFGLLRFIVPVLEGLGEVPQAWPHRFDAWRHTLFVVDNLEGVVAVATGEEPAALALSDAPDYVWDDIRSTLARFASALDAHLAEEVSSGHGRLLLLKLVTLLHDAGKLETISTDGDGGIHFYGHSRAGALLAEVALEGLRFSSREQARASCMVRGQLRPGQLGRESDVTRRAVYRYYRDLGDAGVDTVLLGLADYLATWGPNVQEESWHRWLEIADMLLNHYFNHYDETVSPLPLLSGRDVMEELALAPGPQIGEVLEAVLEAQAAGEVVTRDEALAVAREIVRGIPSSD